MATPADHVRRSRAAYGGSAARYVQAVGTELSERFEAPEDRAVLAAFADLAAGHGPVLDAGCGPGRVAAFLARAGLDVRGVDVAPEMVREARAAHPSLAFEVAELTALPADDASLAGVAYWYSTITTPPEELDAVWGELDRVLGPAGAVLVAFQAGDGGSVERPDAYGSGVDLHLYRHDVATVCGGLARASLRVRSVLRREPVLATESTPQAFVLAERAGRSAARAVAPSSDTSGHR